MTDREQFYLAAFIIGVLLLLGWWTSQPAESAQPERYKVHIVQPNETLWEIARDKYPDQHTGSKVYEIRKLNGKNGEFLDPGKISPGQRIKIPSK